jgi:CHAT domain-containing protein
LGILLGCAGGVVGLLRDVSPERTPERNTRPAAARRETLLPPPSSSPSSPPSPVVLALDLQPGASKPEAIRGGTIHVLRFPATAGTSVVLEVEQIHIDVKVIVVDPAGRRSPPVDRPTGEVGTERVVFVAGASGVYRAEVEAWRNGDKWGAYRPRLTLRLSPNDRDLREALAETTFYTAKERSRVAGATRDDWEFAAAGFLKAVEIFAELRKPERERDAWKGLGEVRFAVRDWDGSLDAYSRALHLDQALQDHREEALSESQIGRSAEEGERLAVANDFFRRALGHWQELGEPEGEAQIFVNLGHVATKLGEPREAISYFDRTLDLGHRPATRSLALAGRGKARAFAGDWKPAFQDFRDALGLLAPGDLSQRANILLEMANAYLEEKVPSVALARYGETLPLLRSLGDRYGEAVALNGIGVARYRMRDDRGALAAYEEALRVFQGLGSVRGEATARINIGWLQGALGRPEAALDSYRQALPVVREIQDRAAEAAIRFGMASVERDQGNRSAAQRDIETAMSLVESVRDRAAQRDLQAAYLATTQDVYGFLIGLLMDHHREDPLAGHDAEALAVAERAKGRSLLDALSSGGKPGTLLTLGEIQQQVEDGSLLLEYHLGRERSLLWVVSERGMASFELRPRAEIEASARRVFERMAASEKRSQREEARRAAVELGRLLLGPVAGALQDKRLLIVPDGILHYIPFAALPDPAAMEASAAEASGSWPEPLALRHEVVSIASASVLAALRARRRPKSPSGLLASLADPVTDPNDSRLPPSMKAQPPGSLPEESFPRLPEADAEATAIVALAMPGATKGEVLDVRGFAAERDLVLSGALGRYRFLHFSTHGSFDPLHPEQSALVLSLYDRAGHARNGLLHPRDLDGLRWSADLVTLSACETARGRDLAGEGLVGFTQEFLAAGASRVLVSLWQVPDDSTAILMQRFYTGLLHDGLSPAAALRRAQVSLWREPRFRAPHHWAGFVLQGEPR